MAKTTRKDLASKAVYPTLAQAIHAKNAVARHRGDRWRKQLRIYRTVHGWCLTKTSKSNYEYNAQN